MGPKPQTPQSGDLFRFPLAEHFNPKHDLVLLGAAITIDDMAARAGTIGYEILTNLGRRYARSYRG